MKFKNKFLLFFVIVLMVFAFVSEAWGLNVTDDLDMNQGQIYNASKIGIGTDVTPDALLEITNSSLTDLYAIFVDVAGDTNTIIAPLRFEVDHATTSSGSKSVLAIDGLTNAASTASGNWDIYGARFQTTRTSAPTNASTTTNFWGVLHNMGSVGPNAGESYNIKSFETAGPNIASFVNNGELNHSGVYVNSPTVSLLFDNPTLERYGVYIEDFTDDANWNESYAIYIEGGALYSEGTAEIVNDETTHALKIDQNADAGSSTSVGGAINLDNTDNPGAGIIIYSNEDSAASGRLMNIRADNSAFDQAAFHIDYDGTANALEVVHNGRDSTAQAFNVVSNNADDSAFTVTSNALSKGVAKIVHTGNSSTTSASAISIDLQGTGTAAQGIFIDSTTGGTTGDLLKLRNNGVEEFVVASDGDTQVNGKLTVTVDDTEAFVVEDSSGNNLFTVRTSAAKRVYVPEFKAAGNWFSVDEFGGVWMDKTVAVGTDYIRFTHGGGTTEHWKIQGDGKMLWNPLGFSYDVELDDCGSNCLGTGANDDFQVGNDLSVAGHLTVNNNATILGALYANDYYSSNSNQGLTTNISTGSCNMAFENGLLIWTDCGAASGNQTNNTVVTTSDLKFNDSMFITQFLILIGIVLVKVFNLIKRTEFYNQKVFWILNIVLTIAFGIGLMNFLSDFSNTTLMVLFQFEIMLFVLAFVVGILELLFYIGKLGNRQFRGRASFT